MLNACDDRLKAICRAHFHIKSDWYFSFPDVYEAGKISDDGRILSRSVLMLSREAKNRVGLDHQDVLVEQRFEIENPAFQKCGGVRRN